jgi:hypothetical protein
MIPRPKLNSGKSPDKGAQNEISTVAENFARAP